MPAPDKIILAEDPTQTPTVTKQGVPVNPAVPDPIPFPVKVEEFISEGVAKEIEMHGTATDPRTGLALDKSALPEGRGE